MEWIRINTNKLPKGEVLAGNFMVGSYGYKEKIMGYLHKDKDGVIACENESQILENCTHYVDIDKFDPSPTKE